MPAHRGTTPKFKNRGVIEVLGAAEIEKWEGKADEFRDIQSDYGTFGFRQVAVTSNPDGSAQSKILPTFSNRYAGNSTVCMMMNNKRNLTKDHIKALCA